MFRKNAPHHAQRCIVTPDGRLARKAIAIEWMRRCHVQFAERTDFKLEQNSIAHRRLSHVETQVSDELIVTQKERRAWCVFEKSRRRFACRARSQQGQRFLLFDYERISIER
jgi:hypothetical protein